MDVGGIADGHVALEKRLADASRHYPVGSLSMPILVVTTVMCRSTGALLLMASGLSTLWLCTRFDSKLFMWALLLVAPLYYAVRIPNYWTGADFANLVRTYLGEERSRLIRVSPGE